VWLGGRRQYAVLPDLQGVYFVDDAVNTLNLLH
jgi:hypothetical protein